MAQPLDPYRTLGLAPGATLDDIRRAYRRLAKANHPDSAGEAALPRFLAIQAAYEMLTEGRGRLSSSGRRPSTRGAASGNGGGTASGEPAGARTTRGADSRRKSGAGTATGGTATGGRASNRGGRPTGSGAGAGASGGERPPGQTRRPGAGRRSPNKATLGSTSYDAAEDEPFEPEWAGGTWYGASSGTYWTLNPKEYADPRKHGPAYQRRARRRLDGLEPEEDGDDPSFSGEGFGGPESETAAGGERRREGFDGRWAYPDESDEPPAREGDDDGSVWVRWSPDPDADADAGPRTQTARPALDEIADRILAGRVGFAGRFVVAFFGWAPIAAVIAWLAGELSGCGRFTATCADPAGVWTTIPLLAVYGLLVAAPSVAGISAAGLLGSLAASVPAAVILSAGGGSRQQEASTAVLTVLFFIGYVVGVLLAVARKLGWRRVPSP